jgi:hypothetical protein
MTRNAVVYAALSAVLWSACSSPAKQRTYGTPEDAVKALITAAKSSNLDELVAIFGPESQELIGSSDPVTARSNRDVFVVATRERWQFEGEAADRKTLFIGNEEWPFPVPLVKEGNSWRWDTAAGKEEVLARRIGRNELATIQSCRAYVRAQRQYAQDAHDGKPAGTYAAAFTSDPGKQNGLYWPAARGQKRSPLGDLVAQAATEGTALGATKEPTPFHGYYFKILTAQGAAAPGGAKSYVVNGRMSGGFALVAWPAQYDLTGVMTFLVGPDGTIHEKDLGGETAAQAGGIKQYDPDSSWEVVK